MKFLLYDSLHALQHIYLLLFVFFSLLGGECKMKKMFLSITSLDLKAEKVFTAWYANTVFLPNHRINFIIPWKINITVKGTDLPESAFICSPWTHVQNIKSKHVKDISEACKSLVASCCRCMHSTLSVPATRWSVETDKLKRHTPAICGCKQAWRHTQTPLHTYTEYRVPHPFWQWAVRLMQRWTTW